MSKQVSRGSPGEYQSDERAGVARLGVEESFQTSISSCKTGADLGSDYLKRGLVSSSGNLLLLPYNLPWAKVQELLGKHYYCSLPWW